MANPILLQQITEGNSSMGKGISYPSKTILKIEGEEIPDSTTDLEFLFAIDISAMQVFFMQSDQILTVETNSGGTPQETFSLVAFTPVIWRVGDTAIFAGDVTSLFVTNASGNAAVLDVMVGIEFPSV